MTTGDTLGRAKAWAPTNPVRRRRCMPEANEGYGRPGNLRMSFQAAGIDPPLPAIGQSAGRHCQNQTNQQAGQNDNKRQTSDGWPSKQQIRELNQRNRLIRSKKKQVERPDLFDWVSERDAPLTMRHSIRVGRRPIIWGAQHRLSMRPSWAQLLLLAAFSLSITSIIAHFHLFSGGPDCGQLFSRCNALELGTGEQGANLAAPTQAPAQLPTAPMKTNVEHRQPVYATRTNQTISALQQPKKEQQNKVKNNHAERKQESRPKSGLQVMPSNRLNDSSEVRPGGFTSSAPTVGSELVEQTGDELQHQTGNPADSQLLGRRLAAVPDTSNSPQLPVSPPTQRGSSKPAVHNQLIGLVPSTSSSVNAIKVIPGPNYGMEPLNGSYASSASSSLKASNHPMNNNAASAQLSWSMRQQRPMKQKGSESNQPMSTAGSPPLRLSPEPPSLSPMELFGDNPLASPFISSDRNGLTSSQEKLLQELVQLAAQPTAFHPQELLLPGKLDSHRLALQQQHQLQLQLALRQQQQQHQLVAFAEQHGARAKKNRISQPSSVRNLVGVGSASAPSIALPPLTHLLAPRNPFRLFASSSTPVGSRQLVKLSRIRPVQQQPQQQQQQQQQSSSHPVRPSYWPISEQQQVAASLAAASLLPGFYPDLAASAEAAHEGRLYAHSGSARQLEQLVRAASQASGTFHSGPAILPAIVSDPSGPFPGLYIPAIENESESQVSELRLHESNALSAGASSAISSSTNSILSKIPGTDYILHPDEVRAMINIGESAWRNQNQNNHEQSTRHGSASEHWDSFALPAATGHSHWMRPAPQLGLAANQDIGYHLNLLAEDHAQNAQDFAYTDPLPASNNTADNAKALNAKPDSQPITSGRHWMRAFPAFLRLSESPYHQHNPNRPQTWPVRSVTSSPVQLVAASEPITSASPPSVSQTIPDRLIEPRWPDSLAEDAPIRLATQLTSSEIRQVEQSVMEALVAEQQREQEKNQQHRRRLLHQLAAAASMQTPPILISPILLSRQVRAPSLRTRTSKPIKRKPSTKVRRHRFQLRRRRNLAAQPSVSHPDMQHRGQRETRFRRHQSPESLFIPMVPLMPTFLLHLPVPLLTPSQPSDSRELSSAGQQVQWATASRRFPVLLADQETNKASAQIESRALTAATEPRVSLLPAPIVFSNSNNKKQKVGNCKRSFGSRVLSSASPDCGSSSPPTRPPSVEQLAQPALVEGTEKGGLSTSASGSAPSRTRSQRVYVDWPAMMSDADYFPAQPSAWQATRDGATGAEARHQRLLAKLDKQLVGETNRPNWPTSNQIRTSQAGQQRLQHQAASLAQIPEFVTSQLKLQFAQDYQAREGVPIYNNNVRAAGVLDRIRAASIGHRRQPRPEHVQASSESDTEMDDSTEFDEQLSSAASQSNRSTEKSKSLSIGRKDALKSNRLETGVQPDPVNLEQDQQPVLASNSRNSAREETNKPVSPK